MKTCSKALLGAVIAMVLAGGAQAFPEAGRHNGMEMYRTGSRVQDQYMAPSNVIQNLHHYHLSKPPEGYIWVHGVDNEYLLVSVNTHVLRRIESRPNIPPETPGKD